MLYWSDPQSLVNCCLARKHHALGQKTIDGVLCEGIETTDSSGPPVKRFAGRLWVSVETGCPVLVEVEVIDDGSNRHTSTIDQFQWNVDLSASDVEPEIPADYRPI
jgi:outer membrane lipoprotein-sorting protein